MEQVAFIITVYKNDKVDFFKQAVESIINQNYELEKIHIYLGIDGIITDDIEEFINQNQDFFYKVLRNDTNFGLAYTLNRLINILEDEEYIFRMDSDDICKLDRINKQLLFLKKNQRIEIIGGAIEEIDEEENVKMIRTYPKSSLEAKKFIPKASIFAHPTVCFRKSFFNKGFRYSEHYRFNQDLGLWYEALINDIQISNVDDIVLSLRTSNDFYKRRSYKRAFGEFSIYWRGIKSLYGYNYRLLYPLLRLITRLLPPSIVKVIYNKRFRKVLNK